MKHVKLSEPLNAEVLYKLPFGSQIYTNVTNDKDFIYLIPESTGNFVLQYSTSNHDIDTHQLGNQDITYVGINEFIKGLSNCSNVEFFEALHTIEGEKFLDDHNLNLIDYYTPRMMKAYLGYAKRDAKADFKNRLFYIVKSIILASHIRDKEIYDPERLYPYITSILYNDIDREEILKQIDDLRKGIKYNEST